MDFFRLPEERLLRAEAEHKRVLRDYDDEQRKAARRRQAELDAAAQRERERLARESSSAPSERLPRSSRNCASKGGGGGGGRAAEAERLRIRAQGVEEAAASKAKALGVAAASVVSAVAPVVVPKIGGLRYTTVWKFEITDKAAVPSSSRSSTRPPSAVSCGHSRTRPTSPACGSTPSAWSRAGDCRNGRAHCRNGADRSEQDRLRRAAEDALPWAWISVAVAIAGAGVVILILVLRWLR